MTSTSPLILPKLAGQISSSHSSVLSGGARESIELSLPSPKNKENKAAAGDVSPHRTSLLHPPLVLFPEQRSAGRRSTQHAKGHLDYRKYKYKRATYLKVLQFQKINYNLRNWEPAASLFCCT